MKNTTSSRNTSKTILFTGGGGAGSEALFRMMDLHYEVHFADADIHTKPYSIPSERFHQIPIASDPSFIPQLTELSKALGVDLLIPSVDEELLSISQARKAFGCEVLLPPTEFISAHTDKLVSSSRLQSLGLPVPHTEMLADVDRMSFPCIVKPRRGRGSRGVAIVNCKQELNAHITLSRRAPEDFILQELLQGQEYTVMMAADGDSKLHAVVPVKVGIKRGITLRAETDHNEQVIAACVAIHTADPVPGCFNIQLVKSIAGDIKPFEINPRISTTTCLGYVAGVDFVSIFLGSQKQQARCKGGLLVFRDHVGLKRSWYNEFIG